MAEKGRTSRAGPAQRVRDYLQARCTERGLALPSQARLAAQLDASPRTVARVVAEYVADGTIETIPGLGMRVAPLQADISAETQLGEGLAASDGQLNNCVQAWLREQIERGTWPLGTALPTQRTIRSQCGVGTKSLQKAYLDLAEQGLIHRRGRLWYVGPHVSPIAHQHDQYFPVWLVARGKSAREVLSYGGRYLSDIGSFEASCQSFGLALQVRDWQDVLTSAPPHGLLALIPERGAREGTELLKGLAYFRKQREDLRVVAVYGDIIAQRKHIIQLQDGSLWTQVMRRVAEQVVRRQPKKIEIIIELGNGGKLKEVIRLLPELRYRLPHIAVQVQIITGLPISNLAGICTYLETQAQGTTAYFEGLLSNYTSTSIADWESAVSIVKSPNCSRLRDQTYAICNTADHAMQAQWYLSQHDGYLMCLQDTAELCAAGIGVCVHDQADTHRRIAMALHGGYPLERSSRGLLRPGVRLSLRKTG